jgi:hydrogenase nickel incorporation protein HypA/HybF
MHELAIAQSIVEAVEQMAHKHNAKHVKKVKLKLGAFTGVVKDALEFSFEVIREGTLLSNAELEIEIIELQKRCESCGEISGTDGDLNLLCPSCLSPTEIVSGREMQIDYVELE